MWSFILNVLIECQKRFLSYYHHHRRSHFLLSGRKKKKKTNCHGGGGDLNLWISLTNTYMHKSSYTLTIHTCTFASSYTYIDNHSTTDYNCTNEYILKVSIDMVMITISPIWNDRNWRWCSQSTLTDSMR